MPAAPGKPIEPSGYISLYNLVFPGTLLGVFVLLSILGIVLILYDANRAVTFKNRVRDVVDRADAFGSGRRHNVFRVDLHAVQHFVLPLAVLEKRERGAIHRGSKPGKLALDRRHPPVHEPNSQNCSRAIGDGPVLPHSTQDDDAANEKDNYKLKERELAAGSAA